MSSRWFGCLTVSLVLALVSPALAAFVGISSTSERGPFHFWFFGMPELVETWFAPRRNTRLFVWICVYTVQYFLLLYLFATLSWEIRRPRGIEARKAYDKAVTRFHDE